MDVPVSSSLVRFAAGSDILLAACCPAAAALLLLLLLAVARRNTVLSGRTAAGATAVELCAAGARRMSCERARIMQQ